MTAASGRRWAVVAAASGTVLIGAGAFWLSFVALADLAVRSGIDAGQAWIWPLLVDGLIVVATVAVVALDGHRSAWYPWALLIAGAGMSVTANAAHAIVAATASVPALLAALVAAVPPLVLLASTHLTVVLTRSTKTPTIELPAGESPAIAPVREPSPALTEAVNAGSDGQTDHFQRPEPPTRVESTAAEPEMPQTAPSALSAVAPPEASLPEPLDEHASKPAFEPAAAPISASEPDRTEPASPEPGPPEWESRGAGLVRRERAEELRDAGWSNKAIARELGVHASTVGRWFPRTNSGESETEKEEDKEKESDHEPQRA